MISEAHLTAFARETAKQICNKVYRRGYEYKAEYVPLLEAFAKEVAQAQRDLDAPYMQHKAECNIVRPRQFCGVTLGEGEHCTCGLAQVVARET